MASHSNRGNRAFLIMAIWLTAIFAMPAQERVTTITATTTETIYNNGSRFAVAVCDSLTHTMAPAPKAPQKQRRDKPSAEVADPFTKNGVIGHFTWGADLGSGVDLTSHDMTMFELGACFGYKGGWMRFAGVGANIISMMNNSSRCYPVYGMLRTSFSRYHRLCFLEVQAGVSFNSILDYKSQTDFFGSVGIGLTLAHSRKFTSHVVLRGIFMPLSPVEIDGAKHLNYDIGYACIGIGCAF